MPGYGSGHAEMEAGQESQPSGKGTFMLTADMLPPGVELNEGDTLKVVRCTEGGDYEIAKQGGGGDDKQWEQGFKDYMSSQNDGNNPPPPDEHEM